MSGSTTIRMLKAYVATTPPPSMFFSGMFQSPPENFHTSEEVELDIERSGEDVAIVVQDPTTGYRMNSADIYTNKGFKPPVFKEATAIQSWDLIKREAGENPFVSPEFRANIITRVFKIMKKVQAKISRANELQASQVLQTGTVTLTDANGVALYTLDFKPKNTHFPTSSVAWDQTGDTKLADINSLAGVIRGDGLVDPSQLIFGSTAWASFIADADVKAVFETRRLDQGTISMGEKRGNGGTYHGRVEIGSYVYDIWTVSGRYKHPQTGVSTEYMAPGKVIVRAPEARLDAAYGAIPNIGNLLGASRANLIPELPSRFSNAGGGMDMFTNVWLSADGETLFCGIGARPLFIPTAIDSFGCLTTGL